MSEPKFTGGKWYAKTDEDPYINGCFGVFSDDTLIAASHWWGGIFAERMANANLIAAAPELYAALDLCAATLERFNSSSGPVSMFNVLHEIRTARAALAKARGETT